jgi:hypothetical protein
MNTKFILSFFAVLLTAFTATSQAPDWVWAKKIGGSSDDGASAIAGDAAGNIYTIGYFVGTVDFDPGPGTYNLNGPATFVSKLDSLGNFVWAKQLGNSSGISLSVNGKGDVFVLGSFPDTVDFDPGPGIFNLAATGYYDSFICKLDSCW